MDYKSDPKIKELSKLFNEYITAENEYYKKYYPTDIPNDKCKHAILTGIKFENSFGPSEKEYSKLLEVENETAFVWTHTKNKYSTLVIEVSEEVKNRNFWQNLGYTIQIAYDYYLSFESLTETEYRWCYYFDPNLDYSELELYNTSDIERYRMEDATIIKLTDLADLSRLIELFYRDERVFTAINHFYSSIRTHHCCLICEMSKSSVKKHPSHEPEIWEQASVIADFESAIVQACRCVEALLGKPPNRDKLSRLLAFKSKCKELLGIDLDKDTIWKHL